MSKQIIYYNSSLIRQSACLRRIYWMGIKGFSAKSNSIDIEFGQAIHQFIKVLRMSGGNCKEAVNAAVNYFTVTPYITRPKKQWMDIQKLKSICMEWYMVWEEGGDDLITLVAPSDNKPMVEVTFAVPYYADDMFEVILCGTWDDISRKGQNGLYILRDYKTTSSWEIDKYLKTYSLSPQLHFYAFALMEYARLYPQSIFAEIVNSGFGVQVEGIFLKATAPTTVQRSDVYRFGPNRMMQFKQLLDACIKKELDYLRAYPDTTPPPEGIVNGACETKYGTCDYCCLCNASDETVASFMLQNNFTIKPYNPLTIH